ncbi:hypothetical protein K504DRAFT_100669 [Pleomassaria siparia CBS 279.74]|uniref:Uncharacterized protein n=1 Tax=Pleomassaria siparia CBS 279.74 TaxID=1314801 RepID=A0A6G1JXL5_9PLEO|nr:hypothetical protein K504DRAFT_100669 [Pleomassaria siparia CBS 279.74]
MGWDRYEGPPYLSIYLSIYLLYPLLSLSLSLSLSRQTRRARVSGMDRSSFREGCLFCRLSRPASSFSTTLQLIP